MGFLFVGAHEESLGDMHNLVLNKDGEIVETRDPEESCRRAPRRTPGGPQR